MGRFSVGVGLFVAVLGSFVGTAEAQWSAVVLDFEGRGNRPVRSAVLRIVEDRVALEATEDFAAAAEAAGADVGTTEGIAAAAAAQNVSLVIAGEVTGRNRNASATIRFLDAHGGELSSATASSPRNQSTRQRFNREVTAAFDEALGMLDERAASEREGEMADDRAEVVGLDDERPDDEGGGASGGQPYPFVRGLVGLDGRSRDASFNLANGLKRTYQAFFPQLTLLLEVRPFSPSDDALAGFFASFDGAVAVGLTSNEELSSGAVVPVETQAYRFGIVIGYIFDLDTVQLGASLGFTYDAFELAPNNTIPTSAYSSIRIGVLGRIPIMDNLLGAFVDGGLRIIVGTGGLSPSFAESSSGVGFDVMGGLMGALDLGLTYAVRVGYVGYAVGFSGNATVVDETATDGFDGGIFFGGQVGWQL